LFSCTFTKCVALYRRPSATRDKHHYRENQADNEQNPRNVRGCSRNSAKAENPGYKRYDQKSYRPTNHLLSPVSEWDACQNASCRLSYAKRVPKAGAAKITSGEMRTSLKIHGFCRNIYIAV
jgi:hypothetical protein